MFRTLFAVATLLAGAALPLCAESGSEPLPPPLRKLPGYGVTQGIVVRTSENVTQGGWIYLLNRCEALGIRRIDLLVKQDEDDFLSERTGATLHSGDLFLPLPGEKAAPGWEDDTWLREMLAEAKKRDIEIWAWWPCFHDADAARRFPEAAYTSPRQERFVDPGDPRVLERQEELLAKLLDTYPFDGVSLDWIRYEGWEAGRNGPLGERFARIHRLKWDDNTLANESHKAAWYELRAGHIASWIGRLTSDLRVKRPGVRWGGFLLPWPFSEVSQSYPLLGRSGLDYLQPMAYWRDWKKPPEWVGNKALALHDEPQNGAAQWAVLGIDAPQEELDRALKSIPPGSITGLSWFTYATWEEKTFRHLRQITTLDDHNRALFGFIAPAKPQPPQPQAQSQPPYPWSDEPHPFPAESSVWSIVVLEELYRRKALPETDPERIVPVLSLHNFHDFNDKAAGVHTWPYDTSTDYLDALFAFLKQSHYTVTPLSRFQSYLTTGDPSFLPPRPLVITIDDGHKGVVSHFFPRAKAARLPFAVAAITSRMDRASAGLDHDGMNWADAQEINRSGLVEFISHSDDMHYLTGESPGGDQHHPAETSRQYLLEYERRETTAEYRRRIRLDMMTSRRKLLRHGLGTSTVFCWPFGHSNRSATDIARETGFTHFLLYKTPPAFATWKSARDGIPRVPVQLQDEAVPLEFPQEARQQQSWWLAFLRVAIDSHNIPLLEATLAQLTPENQTHPEAELARAAIRFISGDTASGMLQLETFRTRYPDRPDLIKRAWRLLWDWDSSPK